MAVEEEEEEVVAVTGVGEAATVTGTARVVRIVRTGRLMRERVVLLTTVVTGTAAGAVTVTQGVIAMPVPGEVHHVTRGAAPETDRGLMTGPAVDPEAMMIATEKRKYDDDDVPPMSTTFDDGF